jgi:hypothetical protein
VIAATEEYPYSGITDLGHDSPPRYTFNIVENNGSTGVN